MILTGTRDSVRSKMTWNELCGTGTKTGLSFVSNGMRYGKRRSQASFTPAKVAFLLAVLRKCTVVEANWLCTQSWKISLRATLGFRKLARGAEIVVWCGMVK